MIFGEKPSIIYPDTLSNVNMPVRSQAGKSNFMRLLKVIVVLVVLILGTLFGYAYLGDMDVRSRTYSVPVNLTLEGAAPQEQVTTPADDAQ